VNDKVTYVGLDVHAETTVASWGRPHEQVQRLEVPTTREGFRLLNRRIGRKQIWGAYEASSCGFIPYEWLRDSRWRASVIPPTHLKRSSKSRKNKADAKDADMLREHVMAHGELGTEMAEVVVPDAELRDDRELTRQRLHRGGRTSAVKAEILQLLRRQGVDRPPELKSNWTKQHVAWLRGLASGKGTLPPMSRRVLAGQLRELDFLESETQMLDEAVEALARKSRYEAAIRRMRRHKGVGVLTAAVLLMEMGDPHRFANRKKLASFFGLTPTRHDSGKRVDRLGHITRMGSPHARKVLNQAAWAFLRSHDRWKAWFNQVAIRRGKMRAIVALMRKLSIILWHEAAAA
jgi:transposase